MEGNKFTKFSENFSTHLLTWLTNGDIFIIAIRKMQEKAYNNGNGEVLL